MQAVRALLVFICIILRQLSVDSTANNYENIIDALRHVVENDSEFVCHTLGINLQWSTQVGKNALFDIVKAVVPTIKKHAITMSTPNSNKVIDLGFHYVWLFDTLASFNILYQQLRVHFSQNPTFANGFYLLVYVLPPPANYSNDINHMLGSFKELHIFGAIVMMDTPTSNAAYFYASSIFKPKYCFRLMPQIINTFRNGSLQTSKMFERKIENMHRCPIRALIFKSDPYINVDNNTNTLTGFEGEMITTIAQELNATLMVSSQEDYIATGNTFGEFADLFQLLKNNEGDFVAGLQVFSVSKLQHLSPSVSYITTSQILVLRRSRDIKFNSNWLFSPFSLATWIGIACICGSLLLVAALVQYKFYIILAPSQPVVLQIFAVMLGIPSSINPKLGMYRMAFVITCCGLFVVRSIYQGKVYSTYSFEQFEDTPETFDELMHRNYTIYTMEALDVPEILLSHSKRRRRGGFHLISSNLSQRENFELLEQSSGNVAIVATFTYYRYHLAKYSKQTIFKMFPQNLLELKGCIYFRRHSYLTPSVNDIINRLRRSGILHKWFSFYATPDFLQNTKPAHAINMEKIQLVFLWHAYLCGLATVVFILEILHARHKKSRSLVTHN